MSGLLRTIATRAAAPALWGQTVTQRANVFTRPAKDKLGVGQSIFAFSAFAVAILGPSGWVLSHLEQYKKKE